MKINWKEKLNYKKLLPHLIAIVGFLIIISIYFSPVFDGKTLQQHEVLQAKGAGHEATVWYQKTGDPVLWTNSMFSGMPTFQIWVVYPSNLISYLTPLLELKLPKPLNLMFLYFICFYLFLLVFEIKPVIAFLGGLAYAFSSYNIIIIQAGHVNKALAIALLPLVLAGVFLLLKKKYLFGFIVSAIALSLEIRANHFQITYYLLMMIFLLMIIEFIYAIKDKKYVDFFKSVAVMVIAFILAGLVNITPLWINYEYTKFTMRGGTELKIKSKDSKTTPTGLQKDYAYAWSYGKMETFTLLIPKFVGGASAEPLNEGSNTYKAMIDRGVQKSEAKKYLEKMPLYWGPMSSTSGPVYFGAIICYFFLLGMFILKDKIKWWLLTASIFAILLSWGENFVALSNFFFDYFPMYNKFRVPMTLLVIVSICFPIMAALVMKEIYDGKLDKETVIKALKKSFYILGGILLFFILFGGTLFNFESVSDKEMAGNDNQWLVDALKLDRAKYLRMDAFRSLAFIFVVVAAIFSFLKYKFKKEYLLTIIIAALLIDLWAVDKRYFNDKDFVRQKRHNQEAFIPSAADEKILLDKELSYRVLNLSTSPFNDAFTSYFHKSIGGYSGAKLARYQDLIDFHLYPSNPGGYQGEIKALYKGLQETKSIIAEKIPVLNMLNTKYFIFDQTERGVLQNPYCYGNAWFTRKFKIVNDADQEISSLNKENLKETAIIDKKFQNLLTGFSPSTDTTGTIKLVTYNPNSLTYQFNSTSSQLVVFSEVYYDKGWNAYIDGKITPHFRANYILRSMKVPAGSHKIEFKFEPKAYITGEKISLASSLFIILLTIGGIGWFFFYKKEELPSFEHKEKSLK